MENILRKAQRYVWGVKRPSLTERRRLKRMACHQEFVCTRGKESHDITVVDVGFGGFRVRSQRSLGERGTLHHLRRLPTDFRKHLTGSYGNGLMVKVAWEKQDEQGFEVGLSVPEAPGSMRIEWFRELLREFGLDEQGVFSQRNSRRHRCRLPALLTLGESSELRGTLLDLSQGGGLLGLEHRAQLGSEGELAVKWGVKTLRLRVTVVGVRDNRISAQGPPCWHSLKFREPIPECSEDLLKDWLMELSRNE